MSDKVHPQDINQIQSEAAQRFEKLFNENAEHLKEFEKSAELPAHLNIQTDNPNVRNSLFGMARIEEDSKEFERQQLKRNKCSATEYSTKWTRLHLIFEHSGHVNKQDFEQERARLSVEYMERFSPFLPVAITADNDSTVILAVIPPVYKSLNPIQGYDASYIDQFIRYGDTDRIDIRAHAQTGIIQATVNAQKMHVDDLKQIQIDVNEHTIAVLRLFDPQHPLLMKLDGIKTEAKTEESATTEKSTKSPADMDPNSVDLDDINLSDL